MQVVPLEHPQAGARLRLVMVRVQPCRTRSQMRREQRCTTVMQHGPAPHLPPRRHPPANVTPRALALGSLPDGVMRRGGSDGHDKFPT